MTRRTVAILAALSLSACIAAPPSPPPASSPPVSAAPGVTPPPPTPTRPGTPSPTRTPTPTPAPTPTPHPLSAGGALELLVVQALDDERPFFDVQVDAIDPAGAARTVAVVPDVHPAGWADSAPMPSGAVSVSAEGYLLVQAERDGGGTEDSARTLIFDLRQPALPPVEASGQAAEPTWGPDGWLAWVRQEPRDGPAGVADVVTVVSPATGDTTAIEVPEAVTATSAWTADGRGWLAVRRSDLATGALLADGIFERGVVPAHEQSGTERQASARGGRLATGVSDGPDGAEYELVEYGPDLPGRCRCVRWIPWTPADRQTFGEGVWDAAGDGVWLVMGDVPSGRHWLSHWTEPGIDAPVADLPPGGPWALVGISRDDAWVVLESAEPRRITLVDTVVGRAQVVAEPLEAAGGGPSFAGWIGNR